MLDQISNALQIFRKPQQVFSLAWLGRCHPGKTLLREALIPNADTPFSYRDQDFELETPERLEIGRDRFTLDRALDLQLFKHAGLCLHLIDSLQPLCDDDLRIHEGLLKQSCHAITVITKIDQLEVGELTAWKLRIQEKMGVNEPCFVSAQTGEGLEQLAARIANTISPSQQMAFLRTQSQNVDLMVMGLRQRIKIVAAQAAAVTATPLPFADIALLTPLQVAMVRDIALAFHPNETEHTIKPYVKELLATIGLGVGAKYLARQALKLIPVAGVALNSAIAYAGTVAIGETAIQWFKHHNKMSATELKRFHKQAFEKAKSLAESDTTANATSEPDSAPESDTSNQAHNKEL